MRIKVNLSNFATTLSNVFSKMKYIVNMRKLSNTYKRHRTLTHFGNHKLRPNDEPCNIQTKTQFIRRI